MTNITLLDGALGQELVKRSGDRATPLWSTQVMIDHPELVGDLHADYLKAGATVTTTNTYAVHRSRLERTGLDDKMPELLDTALSQAERARATAPNSRIAGSLGPLLASYRPDLEIDLDMAEARFGEIIELMGNRVDLYLIETVSSCTEAEGVLRALKSATKPVWIAFSVNDFDGTKLRSDEPLQDALNVIKDRVQAVLINCSRPEVISDSLPIIAQSGLPFGAYANGFTKISQDFLKDAPTVDALEQRTDLDPETYADFAMTWVEQGATIVGGCCEVGPDHIKELANRLTQAGHSIV